MIPNEQGVPRLGPTRLHGRGWMMDHAIEMIDVPCPRCGATVRLRAASQGRKVRCAECGRMFDFGGGGNADDQPIVADYAAAADDNDADGTADAFSYPEVVEGTPAPPPIAATYSEQPEIVETSAVEPPSAEPVQSASPTPANDEPVFRIPASAIVATPPSPPAPPATPAPTPTYQPAASSATAKSLGFLAACLMLMAGSYWLYTVINRPPDPEQHWAAIMADLEERKWPAVIRKLDEFKRAFPDSPRVEEIPFFADYSAAGAEIFSSTGDPRRGLAAVEQLYREHRDNPAYGSYRPHVYLAIALASENVAARAEKAVRQEWIARAYEGLELLTAIGQTIDESWVAERSAKARQRIAQSEQAIQLELARRKANDLLDELVAGELAGDAEQTDAAYARVEELMRRHDDLAGDQKLLARLVDAHRGEAKRVTYEADPNQSQSSREQRRDRVFSFVVWKDEKSASSAERGGETKLAVAQGVLYAFDSAGNALWARRLGVDSHRLPMLLPADGATSAAVIAVSSEDDALIALDARTGNLLWQYRPGRSRDLSAPLTVVRLPATRQSPPRTLGLLPTVGGEVHVLELVLGKRIGRFDTGFPMTAGGTFDENTGLVFMPAESRRLFVLDPAVIDRAANPTSGASANDGGRDVRPTSKMGDEPPAQPCRAMLFTGHAAGSLRSPPIVVGRSLILAEATDLDRMRLRAFHFRLPDVFADPSQPPQQERTLRGWSWFPPHRTADRITFYTDAGDLGVFGLNHDNRLEAEEALYPLIETAEGNLPNLPTGDGHRALAVYSSEHLAWVVGGRLRKVALDVLHQKIHPLWTDDAPQRIRGVPLHEPQADRLGETFYLGLMSPSGDRWKFTGVRADDGAALWSRQLGIQSARDPIETDDGVVLVDRTGRTLMLRDADAATKGILQPTFTPPLPDGASADDVLVLETPGGEKFLAVPLSGGFEIAFRRLVGGAEWVVYRAPHRIQSRPCFFADDRGRPNLLAPCADGYLHRLRSGSEHGVSDVPYPWSSAPDYLDEPAVYPLGEGAVLLAHDRLIRVLRLESEGGVERWVEAARPIEADKPLLTPGVAVDGAMLLADEGGTLYYVTADGAFRETTLGRTLDAPPLDAGGRLLAVENKRTIVALGRGSGNAGDLDSWTFGPTQSEIVGKPSPSGDVLVVTLKSNKILGVRLTDGALAWETALVAGVGPATAAAPIGPDRVVVPLQDGTLLWLDVPKQAANEREVE